MTRIESGDVNWVYGLKTGTCSYHDFAAFIESSTPTRCVLKLRVILSQIIILTGNCETPGNAVWVRDGENTIGELVSRVQFNRAFVGEEPRIKSLISSNISFANSILESICGRDCQGGLMVAVFDWIWKT
jgi:hypothetical protein